MVKSTAILGSTGSIGRQSVAVCEHLGIRVSAMTTNRNVDLLLEQAARLKPEYVAAFDEAASAKLREALSGSGIFFSTAFDMLSPSLMLSTTSSKRFVT